MTPERRDRIEDAAFWLSHFAGLLIVLVCLGLFLAAVLGVTHVGVAR